jgi:hydrogenase maturation protease
VRSGQARRKNPAGPDCGITEGQKGEATGLPFFREMMAKNFQVTILGLGNILLGDEGFGVHFVRWFEDRYRLPTRVQLMDGGTLGYVLLDTVCNCDHLIIIDAIKIDDAPGSLYRFTQDEMELHMPPPTSAHEVKFADVLCKAEMLGDLPEIVFLCVVPENYGEMNLEMTETLKNRFPEVERLLLEELSRHSVAPEVLSHPFV